MVTIDETKRMPDGSIRFVKSQSPADPRLFDEMEFIGEHSDMIEDLEEMPDEE